MTSLLEEIPGNTNVCYRSFASIVPDKAGSWASSSNRGNVDNRATFSLVDEIGDKVPGRMENALHIHSKHLIEFIFRNLHTWLDFHQHLTLSIYQK
jgi:hypothetical protein